VYVWLDRGRWRISVFLSVAVPVPNGRVGSNITGVGASSGVGWPVNVREIRLQREMGVPACGGKR